MLDYFEYDDLSEGSDDYRVSPEDFSELFVIPSDWTVSTLRDELDDIIDLNPEFQRRSVWSHKAKSKFIESLIMGIPIPQILLAESQDRRNYYLVLDGKQRLQTIMEFFSGKVSNGKPFKLSGLDDLKELNKCDWQNLQDEHPIFARSLLAAQVRTAVIRGWRNDNVLYEIFHRLNSGSVRLSPMELRMSLIRGPFIGAVTRFTERSGPMMEMLRLSEPDKRMKDVEIAIRHMAFNDDRIPYSGNLKVFLDGYCRLMNMNFDMDFVEERIDRLNEVIDCGLKVFGEKEFGSKYNSSTEKFETRFNRAIFDVLATSFESEDFRKFARANPDKVKNAFVECCRNGDFLRAVEVTTKTPEAVSTRFSTWFAMVKDISGVKLQMPRIEDARDKR